MNDRIDATISAASTSPAQTAQRAVRAGLLFALGAYLWWGFVPLYFKLVRTVPALEVLGHRIVWSVLFLAILLTAQRKWRMVGCALRAPKVMAVLIATTLTIGLNWYLFIWAVANNHVLQGSLGYFINPLITVLLGVIFLRERLRTWQIAALTLAAAGVINLAVSAGVVPWIALTLAASFGLYGLLRKVVSVGPLVGLFIETALLLPFGIWIMLQGALRDLPGADAETSRIYAILFAAGLVTSLPLLWFTAATRRLRLATIGFLQYLSPSCQFLLAVFAFHEPFTRAHAVTFACIWAAVAVFSIDSIRAYREAKRTSVQEPMTFMQE